MRKLPIAFVVSAVGLALALASPADAAKRKYRSASAPKQYMQTVDAPRSQSVYYGNKYLGADPDPRIRFELQRDLGAAFGGLN